MLILVSKRTIGPKPLVLNEQYNAWRTFGFNPDDVLLFRAGVLAHAKKITPSFDLKAGANRQRAASVNQAIAAKISAAVVAQLERQLSEVIR